MAKMVFRTLEIMPFGTNCYLVGSEQTRDGMVIDPAGDAPRIVKNIEALGLKIGLIVVTHSHPDHLGAVAALMESTGASFALHKDDAEIIRRYDLRQFMGGDPAFRQPPSPDRLLQDGDSIEVGDLTFKVLHTPGHSPGGICLLGHGVVFTGDTLFDGSIGRTDFPGGNHNLLISGIKSKILALSDQTVVLPGHGPKTTVGKERRSNPFLR